MLFMDYPDHKFGTVVAQQVQVVIFSSKKNDCLFLCPQRSTWERESLWTEHRYWHPMQNDDSLALALHVNPCVTYYNSYSFLLHKKNKNILANCTGASSYKIWSSPQRATKCD